MVIDGEFQGDITNPQCPARLVLDRIGDKWTVLVVSMLRAGPRRFTALRNAIGGVAPKVLTQTLRSLQRDGLLTRTVYPEIPPKVVYELTDLGRSLCDPIETVVRWAEDNVNNVLRARENYAAETAGHTSSR